ncbi:MAG TPA: hypothetical protein VGS07_15085 [Thermoanaerobaculia bacterium]|nr:hypothetical protein [Thermoanaerobaculia bacterium]
MNLLAARAVLALPISWKSLCQKQNPASYEPPNPLSTLRDSLAEINRALLELLR